MVAVTPIGNEVAIKVLRDGAEKTLHAKVAEMPPGEGEPAAPESGEKQQGDKLGLKVAPVTPEVARELGVEAGSGVLVQAVRSGSVAEEAGLQPGDVITEVNRKPTKNPEEFKSAIDKTKEGQSVLLLVRRGDSTLFLALKR
jgi:serine protease Do